VHVVMTAFVYILLISISPSLVRSLNTHAYKDRRFTNAFHESILPSRRVPSPSGDAKSVDVVMGFAGGPGYYKRTRYFVGSLRATGYTGDIILGTDPDINEAWLDFFAAYNVTIRHVKGQKCASTNESALPNCVEISGTEASMNFARYYVFQEWLKDYSSNARVMISDVRDVYFQANPFENVALQESITSGYDLLVFEEGLADTSENFTWTHPDKWNFNRGWLLACWGEDALKQASAYAVSCSGVTMGTQTGIASYLQAMAAEMTERSLLRDESNCPGSVDPECDCRTGGIDQGYHNFVLTSGKLGSLRVKRFARGAGPVNTVGAMCSNEEGNVPHALPLDKDGQVLDRDGSKSAVVHQYDRCTFPKGWTSFFP
jgi:hypothetical protein